MTHWYYLIILPLLFLCEISYFKIADNFNIVDKPNERSSHTRVTLRGGGIIFYIGVLLYAIVSGFRYPFFIAGLTLIAGVSFVDDIRSVPNRVRLLFHFAGMVLLFAQWGLFSGADIWYLVTALVVCTGIINAFNFMDGINGMTGAYSLGVLVPLVVLNREIGFVDPRLPVIVTISLAVFCFYNFRTKAKCFAGDVGAVGIAFIIIFLLGLLILSTGNFFYIIFLAVYGVDTVFTIIRRLILRENIFRAHRRHVYQIMSNELGMRHIAVSSLYMLIQLVISFGAIRWQGNRWVYFAATVALLTAGYFCVLAVYRRRRQPM